MTAARGDMSGRLRIAVVGHVEHVTLGRVAEVPPPGSIVFVQGAFHFAGGGGGVAFAQLARGPAEVHFFTAVGSDATGDEVLRELAAVPGGQVHAARRAEPHTRALAVVDDTGERTIFVIGQPQHPRLEDPLPWDRLAGFDAVYFTGEDPGSLRAARAARLLVVTARRKAALDASGVRADVVVGSGRDPRESSGRAEYAVAPDALVLTEGAAGGSVTTATATWRFAAPPSPPPGGGAYGAGDSFAAALTFYLAAGLPLAAACERAGRHGAAVLAGVDPRAGQIPLELP